MKIKQALLVLLFAHGATFAQEVACKDPKIHRFYSEQYTCHGDQAVFKVDADNVVSYQWQSAPANTSNWADLTIPSSQTSTLTFSASVFNNFGSYRCKLTGKCSVVYTSVTYLFAYSPGSQYSPTILSEPGNSTVPENSTASFSIKAANERNSNENHDPNNWGYQWQEKISGNWVDLEGEIENALDISATIDRNGALFRCKVKGCYSKYSREAKLTVEPAIFPNNNNYVKETTVLRELAIYEDTGNLTAGSKSVKMSYFDGLGRPMQTVTWQHSPEKKDLIQPTAYDNLGREKRKYLPFTSNQTNGEYLPNPTIIDKTGAYIGPAANFYAPGSDNYVADDLMPWSETLFEPSPINRVVKQGAPGKLWQPDRDPSADDYTNRYEYSGNLEGEVLLWQVIDDECRLAERQYYKANELYLQITKGEGWRLADGVNGIIKEYFDKQNRTILKRTYVEGAAHDTYYVYDRFNNLRYVIPPQAVEALANAEKQR